MTTDELCHRATETTTNETEVDRHMAFGVGAGGEVTLLDLHESALLPTAGGGGGVAWALAAP